MSQAFVMSVSGDCPYICGDGIGFSSPGLLLKLQDGFAFMKKGVRVEVFEVQDGLSSDIPAYTINNESGKPLSEVIAKFWQEKKG